VRVAWEVTPLTVPATGIGRYLIGAISGVASVRPDWEIAAIAVSEPPGIEAVRRQLSGVPSNVTVEATVRHAAWVTRRIVTSTGRPSLERFAGGPCDAFIDSEWFRPSQSGGARLSIVYDVIPLLFPEWVSSRTRKAHLRSLREIEERTDTVIAISEATKSDLVRYLSIPAERISVAYPGVGREYREASPAAPTTLAGRPYVVAVGSTNARKNLLRLLDAFAQVACEHADVDLVVVGAPDADEAAIADAVNRLRITDRVHRLGYVPDAEIAGVVAAARALVFPSLYEGFGMPVVEAQAAGVPVAASANPSLDEACGDGAVRFDPLDVHSIYRALTDVLVDDAVRQRVTRLGSLHASSFTWESAGDSVALAIERASRRIRAA
jgi:glycosyltransferase involved in cell wall biosynthesis